MGERLSIQQLFENKLGVGEPTLLGMAPGRVNLIGEHTDYNDGFVLPMALEFKMEMAAKGRDDARVRIYSADYDQIVEFNLDASIESDREHSWSNYLRGVCKVFQQRGFKVPGMDLAFCGSIPQGAGLSSSAALEVMTALIIQALGAITMERPETALLCQQAENEFVGIKCGVMDQFASLMGKQGRALFLDCRSLQYELIPLELGDYRIVICHSGVKHELVASQYNTRRQNCMDGVAILQKHEPQIRALRDVTVEMLETYRAEIIGDIYRRCKHVVTENQRVLDSIEALRSGELARFGALMNLSHDSQRDLFDVSCEEVDRLVELARKIPGVLGARITGGGFGGCTVNLVAADAVEQFTREVIPAYRAATGIEARLFVCTPEAGAQITKLN